MLAILATEAAGAAVVALAGSVAGAATRDLVALLRRRLPSLPSQRDRLAKRIRREAERDPAFVRELAAHLAALGDAGDPPVCPYPPDPFFDRAGDRDLIAGTSTAESGGIWLVAGMVGAGKTAFVRRIAHDVADEFPTGQVYVDLDEWRSGETLQVAEVQQHILGQLGIGEIAEAAAALDQQYLWALLRRRLVLILENVLGEAELRPLAHPWPGSLVLVTTRRATTDLRAWCPPDRLVELPGLDELGARELLASRCDQTTLAAEPEPTRQLLLRCDRMPFALLHAGGMLNRRRGAPGAVAAVLAELDQDPDLPILARCVAALSADTADSLRTLAQHPGSSFTYASAQAMLGRPAGRSVDELVDARLVERDQCGRLRLLHLVRQYVRQYAGPDAAQRGIPDEQAFDRILAFYDDRAVAADVGLSRDRLRPIPVPLDVPWPEPAVHPVDWLDAEVGAVVELVRQAHERGKHEPALRLCGALEQLHYHRGRHWQCVEAFEWGIRSAEALDRPVAQARMHASYGRILALLHEFARAESALDTAARLAAPLDHPELESSILEFHGRLHEERAEHLGEPDHSAATDCLRRAVGIDERAGLARSLAIHRRILANLLVKAGAAAEARDVLTPHLGSLAEARNTAREHMVLAKVYTLLGELDEARAAVTLARELFDSTGADQYELELADIEGETAFRAGQAEQARAWWGFAANRYSGWGHSAKADYYLRKLDQLPPPPR